MQSGGKHFAVRHQIGAHHLAVLPWSILAEMQDAPHFKSGFAVNPLTSIHG